jgi:hypothetical protein
MKSFSYNIRYEKRERTNECLIGSETKEQKAGTNGDLTLTDQMCRLCRDEWGIELAQVLVKLKVELWAQALVKLKAELLA